MAAVQTSEIILLTQCRNWSMQGFRLQTRQRLEEATGARFLVVVEEPGANLQIKKKKGGDFSATTKLDTGGVGKTLGSLHSLVFFSLCQTSRLC